MSSHETSCPLCQRPNRCGADPVTGATRCWCSAVVVPPALVAQLPAAQRGTACICRDCIESFHRQASTGTKAAH